MPSPTIILAILLAIAVAGDALLGKLYVRAEEQAASEKQARVDFIAGVKVIGDKQEKETAAKIAQAKRDKEKADAENYAAVKHLNDTIASLRRSRADRASSGYLSPAAPGAASPQVACLARTDSERAIRDFVEGSSGIIEEGDRAIADLNTAKAWAQH